VTPRCDHDLGPDAAVRWPDRRYAWYVIGVLNLAYLVAFADRIVLGLLVVLLQRDLRLTDTEIGIVTGLAFGVCYTVFSLPAGYMADRFSRRNLVAAGMAAWSVATAACGLAGSFSQLFLARVGVGIGEAVLHPTTTSLVADYFPPRDRARAFGFYMMAGAAGTTFAFLLGGRVIRWLEGFPEISLPALGTLAVWQATFLIAGLPGLLLAGLMLLTVREPVRRGRAAETRPPVAAVARFMNANRRTFLCHIIGAPLLLTGGYSLMNWLPTFFARVHGWETAKTSTIYGLTGGLASMVGAVTAGYAADTLRRRGLVDGTYRTALYGGIGLNACGAVAMVMPTPTLAMAALTAASFFLLSPAVTAVACINEIAPNRMRARISGVYTFMVGLITNSIGPFGVGLMTDHVFKSQAAINYALLCLMVVTGTAGALVMAAGLRSYRKSVQAAAAWEET
jgi:MFS family permease